MSTCDHNCDNCKSSCDKNKSLLAPSPKNSKIKKIIGVISGKGGVGKSMVTSLLATQFAKEGFKVGILDSDITGPSIPASFGVTEAIKGNQDTMFPSESKLGIKMISINLLLQDPESPVLWRGPVIGGAIKQFYSDTCWGDLDYLFVDMPPGTGDVALTVFQSIPVDGVIIVSTPQDLVKMIVGKAVSMCNQMNIPVIGLVENMSYMKCTCCNEKVYPFGPSKLEDVAFHFDILPIQSLPINPEYDKLVDTGKIEEIDTNFIEPTVEVVKKFGKLKRDLI